tara:strand:+ start:282 stop:1265 length:984 start_codon:yes stop_codon:yes gene_type:complete
MIAIKIVISTILILLGISDAQADPIPVQPVTDAKVRALIPEAPASVMKRSQQNQAPVKAKPRGQAKPEGQKALAHAYKSSKSEITVEPGVNQLIVIAVGHPNRIVTPFENVTVTSAEQAGEGDECGNICIKENVIYVATDQEDKPITMFVTEQGNEDRAISLTLVAKEIPPKEIFLKLPDGEMFARGGGSSKAKAWENSQPYVESVKKLLRNVALGTIPQGYTLGKIPANVEQVNCPYPGMDIDFSNGQYMIGHNLRVLVGVATNISDNPIELNEAVCADHRTAAIAGWPYNYLEPGQATELYIVRKRIKEVDQQSVRPSLIGSMTQ